jgi:hypothetical protein
MSRVKCFFYHPSVKVKRFFRRYALGTCPGPYRSHNAEKFWDEIEVPIPVGGYESDERVVCREPDDEQKNEFPVKCDYCDFEFSEFDNFQINTERMYQCDETGEFHSIKDLPPGAMYYADWMPESYKGPDGHCLMVICPDGHPWTIDGRANNCTMPKDNEHKCWVRHGSVPNITVDKNGKTCGAGAGSILTPKYHGFLRNGYLEAC